MERCWNCGSSEYINVESLESCPSCDIECDYHGGSGANDAYERASRAKHEREPPDYKEDYEYW